jgi:DUF2075 family protein
MGVISGQELLFLPECLSSSPLEKDTTGVIRSLKRKVRQHNGQQKKIPQGKSEVLKGRSDSIMANRKDTTGVIRSLKRKVRQHNGQQKSIFSVCHYAV